jgi:hypothetical protein
MRTRSSGSTAFSRRAVARVGHRRDDSDGLSSAANVSFGNVGELRDAYANFPGGAREDGRGNALVVWDRFEPTSGKLLLACLH